MAFSVIACRSCLAPLRPTSGDVHVDDCRPPRPLRSPLPQKLFPFRVEFFQEQVETVRPDMRYAPLVEGSVLVDVAFGKSSRPEMAQAHDLDAEKWGNLLGTPPWFFLVTKARR